jgi:beta-xylosidase
MGNKSRVWISAAIDAFLLFIIIFPCLQAVGQNTGSPGKADATVDFSKLTGKIKPLHGVNDGPFDYGPQSAPITFYHAEAGFPYTRLHDVNWPNAEAVDIHAIFPIFDADADDPKNYCFEKTDDYIAPIIKNKSEIIYRLGESIEHRSQYFIHPPKDYAKWAKICVNIIRHYNDGWNNGFHYNIKYWEIWNEPEGKNMWLGTDQQYFELYEVAAKAIKQYNPSLQVGGPAATGVKSGLVKPFLAYCRDRSLPLDFFSWHCYTDKPENIVNYVKSARMLLDEYGFTTTKSFLDEWHYMNVPWSTIFPGNVGNDADLTKYSKVRDAFAEINGPKAAVFAASVLMLLQDTPIDVATYYNADYYNPFSMFDIYGIPGKVYYVFKAFNQLAKMGDRVSCISSDTDNTTVLLAALSEDKKAAAILISNSSTVQRPCNISLKSFPDAKEIRADVYRVDQTHNLDLTERKKISTGYSILKLDLSPSSVYLVKLTGG